MGASALFTSHCDCDYRRIISNRKSGHVPRFGARLQRVKATLFRQPIDGTRNGGRVPYTRVTTAPRTFTELCDCTWTWLPWHTFLAPFDINGMKEALSNKGQRSSISTRISCTPSACPIAQPINSILIPTLKYAVQCK